VITQKGQITDHKRLLRERFGQTTAYRLAVMKHVFKGHRKGGGVPKSHHRKGITHQHHISACFLNQGSAEAIPCSEHRDCSP
tara:strand:+ start:2119 stop:2364 length:246 start_codon:yes stop_codon:yes gene_type:complete